MPRTRPRSLNLRTPIGGIYGNNLPPSPPRRSPSRPRYCRRCSAYYTMAPSPIVTSPIVHSPVMSRPAIYPVPYMFPMVYAATPAPMATPLAASPVIYRERVYMPEPPYPEDTDETETEDIEEMRTTTEENFSTLQRNTLQRSTLQRSTFIPTNLIRDFEETNWISIDDKPRDVQDLTIKRNHWFQRSVELPPGIITKLTCEKLPPETTGNSTMERFVVQRLRITGRVRKWSPIQKAYVEEGFNEVSFRYIGNHENTRICSSSAQKLFGTFMTFMHRI